MNILYVASCGFGDVSWSTSWPRIFSERGHAVDVFLMKYTGNPFHANPYVKNTFIEDYVTAAEKIRSVVETHSYDAILIPSKKPPYKNCTGVDAVLEATRGLKNVYTEWPLKVPGLDIPLLAKPEWHFSEKELGYVGEYSPEPILFHPVSSAVAEQSRNISFDLIRECAEKIDNVVMAQGGVLYTPVEELKKTEASGVGLLWENHNCFDDGQGTALGKQLALVSRCRVGVHGWSGSMCMSMGFNKPYVVVVPRKELRGSPSAPYVDSKNELDKMLHRVKSYGCLIPSAWCITDDPGIVVEAINLVQTWRTGFYDGGWTLL